MISISVVWNSRSQHKYLLIYRFKLKSVFALRLNDTSYSKSIKRSEQEGTSQEYDGTTFNPVHTPWSSATIHNVTDGQTDDDSQYRGNSRSSCVQQYDRLRSVRWQHSMK